MNIVDAWERDDFPFPGQCVAILHHTSEYISTRCGRYASDCIGGYFPVCAKHKEALKGEADPKVSETYRHIEVQLAQESRLARNLQGQVDLLQKQLKQLAPLGIKKNGLPVERPASYYADKVYFIRCEGFIKIGKAQRPENRVKEIRRGGILFPRQLDLEASELIATELGGIERERELHARFAHLRHTGEWFIEAPELTEYIESLSKEQAA